MHSQAEWCVEINRSSPIPIYHQVAVELEKRICDGRLQAGARLQSEVALCRRLHISRATLRRAIQNLVDDGVLVRERGIGTYVANQQSSVSPTESPGEAPRAPAGVGPAVRVAREQPGSADTVTMDDVAG